MKIRIQILDYADDRELAQRSAELKRFCKLLKLRCQKVVNRPYENIFYVQLPNTEAMEVVLGNALLAYGVVSGCVCDFAEDSYPGNF